MEKMEEPGKKLPDLSGMFDLSGDKKIAGYVARFEELFRQRDAANADLKQLADDAAEDMIKKREIEAIKKIAKWKNDGKIGAAQELMAALHRVSSVVKVTLFDWADKTT